MNGEIDDSHQNRCWTMALRCAAFFIVLVWALAVRAEIPEGGDAGVAIAPRTATMEELERRIDQLEEKLEILKKRTQDESLTRSPHSVPEASPLIPPTETAPQVYAGASGFSLRSADGADQIRLHGELTFDGRFYADDLTPRGSRSTWLLRRVRPIVEGTFDKIFDFRFNPDFAGGRTIIQDAYIAARFNPRFVVTAGKMKEPFGLERLQLSPNNRFIELGLPSDLVPNRDIGLQLSGVFHTFPAGTLTYQLGYFDGVVDGDSTDTNPNPDITNSDKKDWVARLFVQPFSDANGALRGLGAGFALSYIKETGTPSNPLLPVYKSETQWQFFRYAALRPATGLASVAGATIADGERQRLSPQAYYYINRVGLLSEYVRESQDVSRTFGSGNAAFTRRARLKPASWQLMATYSLTGEDASFTTITPNHPFAMGDSGWGALELGLRYSALKLDAATFISPSGIPPQSWFADPESEAKRASAWTFGINWYLTPNVGWYLNYTTTSFNGGAQRQQNRSSENAFFTRFQVSY